jgi:hypothetical protein
MEKKEEVGVGRGTHPSIHRGDNFSNQQWGSKRKLEGCKPTHPPGSYKSATLEWAIIIPLGRWSGPQNLKSQKNVRSFTAGLCPDTLICLL